jgi:hypothetical protein
MVSVDELKRPEFLLQWDEAVAIVAEVSATLLERGLSSVPATSSIILTPDGTIRLLDTRPQDGAPVQRLGGLLEMLLASVACPPELRKLVSESVADPPAYPSMMAFADALAYFERPARRDLLKALATRTEEAALQARANAELEQLEARARKQPMRAAILARTTSVNARRFVRLFVAAVLLLGVLAGLAFALAHRMPARAGLTERVRARVDRLAQKGLDLIGLAKQPAVPSSPPETTAPRGAAKESRRAKHKLPDAISLAEIEVWSTSDSQPSSASESHDPATGVSDKTIYSEADVDVEPVVLMRPQMPSEPPPTVSAEEIGVLEIVVSATGTVEHVHLISEANRFHDRMIVAAAKAWSFEPATKDGRPVRYRTHIRVTL